MKRIVACLFILGCLSGVSWGAQCTNGQIQVNRTRYLYYYVPASTGLWTEGSFTWYRDVTYDCYKVAFETTYCFDNSWDAFWGVGASKTVTTESAPVLDGTKTVTEVSWDCENLINGVFTTNWARLDDEPGIAASWPGSVPFAFAEASRLIGRPGEGLDPVTAGFPEAVADYGDRFASAAGVLEELYLTGLDETLPGEEQINARIHSFVDSFFDIANALQADSIDPGPFQAASAALTALDEYPTLNGEPNWDIASPHLQAAAAALTRIHDRASDGIGALEAQWEFLGDIDVLRKSLLDFALALDAVCSDADNDGACALQDCASDDASRYPGAPETNDGIDNQCPGDVGFGVTDEISGNSTFSGTESFCWPPQAGALTYQVARSNEPTFSDGCSLTFTANSCAAVPDVPASNSVLYLLVRALAPQAGSWGENSSGERTGTCP